MEEKLVNPLKAVTPRLAILGTALWIVFGTTG